MLDTIFPLALAFAMGVVLSLIIHEMSGMIATPSGRYLFITGAPWTIRNFMKDLNERSKWHGFSGKYDIERRGLSYAVLYLNDPTYEWSVKDHPREWDVLAVEKKKSQVKIEYADYDQEMALRSRI